jgi:hypothetical protein
VLWAIPYVTAIPLLPLMHSDPTFFKTIMIVEGATVGTVLTAIYFLGVDGDYLRHGIVAAIVWIVLNWILDYVGVIPFSGMSLTRYVIEIGLRYIAICCSGGCGRVCLAKKVEAVTLTLLRR